MESSHAAECEDESSNKFENQNDKNTSIKVCDVVTLGCTEPPPTNSEETEANSLNIDVCELPVDDCQGQTSQTQLTSNSSTTGTEVETPRKLENVANEDENFPQMSNEQNVQEEIVPIDLPLSIVQKDSHVHTECAHTELDKTKLNNDVFLGHQKSDFTPLTLNNSLYDLNNTTEQSTTEIPVENVQVTSLNTPEEINVNYPLPPGIDVVELRTDDCEGQTSEIQLISNPLTTGTKVETPRKLENVANEDEIFQQMPNQSLSVKNVIVQDVELEETIPFNLSPSIGRNDCPNTNELMNTVQSERNKQCTKNEVASLGQALDNFEGGATSLLLQEELNASNIMSHMSGVNQASNISIGEIQTRAPIPNAVEPDINELQWDPTLKCNLCDELYQGLAFCEPCWSIMCVQCCRNVAGICPFCGYNISVIINSEEQNDSTSIVTSTSTTNNSTLITTNSISITTYAPSITTNSTSVTTNETLVPKCTLCSQVPIQKVICPSCWRLLCLGCWKIMEGRCQPCNRKYTVLPSSQRCKWDDLGEGGRGVPRCHVCREEYERSAICEKCTASICEACCTTTGNECPYCENSGFASPLVLITRQPLAEECPICFEPFQSTPQSRVSCPRCSNTVCSSCFQVWTAGCPFCRTRRP